MYCYIIVGYYGEFIHDTVYLSYSSAQKELKDIIKGLDEDQEQFKIEKKKLTI